MNFLECALLADISDVYDYLAGQVDFQKVQETVESVLPLYGEELYDLLIQMVSSNPNARLSLQSIKEYLRICIRQKKQSQNKTIREYHTLPPKNPINYMSYC